MTTNTNLNNNTNNMEVNEMDNTNNMDAIKNANIDCNTEIIGTPIFSTKDFGVEITRPNPKIVEYIERYVVSNNDGEHFVAVLLHGKYRVFNERSEEIHSRRLDKKEFELNYTVVDESEANEAIQYLYNNIDKIEFPNGYPHREKCLVIKFSSIIYLKDLQMYAIRTHVNNEPVGKGYMEVTMNESLYTIYNQQRRLIDKDYYGTMITFKSKTKASGLDEETEEIVFNHMIDNGFLHIKDDKLQLDKNGETIVYRDCLATGSETRKGYLDCCMEKEFDILHNQLAFMGLPLEGVKINLAKLKARGGNVKSNGIGIGTRDIYGNLLKADKFDFDIIKDVEEIVNLNVITPLEDENKVMVGCEEKVKALKVNKNDGFSPASIKVMTLMSLRTRLINQHEYNYFVTRLTNNAIVKMNRDRGTEVVIEKLYQVANKHDIAFSHSMLGEDIYNALVDFRQIPGKDLLLALRDNCSELHEACVNDFFHFSTIDMKYIKNNEKMFRIFNKISNANIVRYQQTFVKGLLVTFDVEAYGFDKEIVLTESMVKIDVKDEYPDFEMKSDLPWLVCKTTKADNYSEYNTQFWMQLNVKGNDLVDLAKEYISKLECAFTDTAQALEILGAIGNTTVENKIGELLQIAPELLGASFVQRKIANLLKYKLAKITKGKIPVKGGYRFIVTDPRVLVPGATTLQPGEYYLNGEVRKVSISRAPALSPHENHLINLVNNERTKGLEYIKDVLVMNPYDCVWMFLGGADFDGDIVFVCWDDFVIDRHMLTDKGINIETHGNRQLVNNDENRKMLFKENLGGANVGEYTNRLINFIDYAYNEGCTPKDIEEILGMGVNYIGKEIDSAKTGEKVELDEYYLKVTGGTEGFVIRKADWLHYAKQEREGNLGKDFYINDNGKNIKRSLRRSQHALGHLFRYMEETYKVATTPVEKNNYFEENCMVINDQPILDKLYTAFSKDEVEIAAITIRELDSKFRSEFANLMRIKQAINDDETFDTMVEELELKHTMIFEQTCANNDIDPMVGAIAAYIAPFDNDSKKGKDKKATSNAYVFHCAYESFYNACKLAFEGVAMFKLPARTLENELEVIDGKVSINKKAYNVRNIEDGVYEVKTLASDNQYLLYARKNSDIDNKVVRYKEITEDIQFITISTRIYDKKKPTYFNCPLGKGKATPLSVFLGVQTNGGEFTIRQDENNNYCVLLNDEVVGLVVKKTGFEINPAWNNCKFKLRFTSSLLEGDDFSPYAFANMFGNKLTGKVSQRKYNTDDYKWLFACSDKEYENAWGESYGVAEYVTFECSTLESLDEEIVKGLKYEANFDYVKSNSNSGIDLGGYDDPDFVPYEGAIDDVNDIFNEDIQQNIEPDVELDMDMNIDVEPDLDDLCSSDPFDDEENFF